ncbi:MAG TPA: CHAD domain-containing protein [Arachnia sp.]|nr:CHAD domain-containing protein [Arachnia sp.]HMT84772.1 CHAD domain-containing protein [Arachnia sp.]
MKPNEELTATEAVRRALSHEFTQVTTLEAGVRTDEFDAVHTVRVALRKMRSFLTIFGPVLDGMAAKRLGFELRWAGQQLAAARDLEVLRARFAKEFSGATKRGRPVPDDVRRLIDADLTRRHEVALERAMEAIDRPRWAAMKAQVAAFLEPGAQLDGAALAEPELSKLARRSERRVARRAELAEADPGHLELWHDVRKAVKSTRYAWEAVAALDGSTEADDAEAALWKDAGSAFGELQDSSVALETIDDYIRHAELAGNAPESYLALKKHLSSTAKRQLTKARTLLAAALS